MLKEKISQLFHYYGVENSNLILCRKDGMPLFFQNGSLKQSADPASMGALLGGLWNAATAVTSFLPNNQQPDFFRLSYDTSHQGVYILPLTTEGESCYLALLYHDTLNPAPLKNKLRNLAPKLVEIVNVERRSNTGHSDNKGDYLFKDISDLEIDKMFARAKS